MKEMQRRSQQGEMPPMPHFVSQNRSHTEKSAKKSGNRPQSLPQNTAIPFLENTDPDVLLILGLFLLLSNENADRLLLYALLYILM